MPQAPHPISLKLSNFSPRKSITCQLLFNFQSPGQASILAPRAAAVTPSKKHPCRDRRTGTFHYPLDPTCTRPPRPRSGNRLGRPSGCRQSARASQDTLLRRIIQSHLQINGMLRVRNQSGARRLRHRTSPTSRNGGACACFVE